ncbi:MAG: S8 family serine peptidase, partial [Butyrivibrio sp.]
MKKMKRFFAFVLCLAMVLPLLNTPALAMTSETTDVVTEDVYDTEVDYDAEYVEGRILIKYSDDTDKALLEERMLENDFWISSDVQMEDGTVAVVCLPDDMDVRTAIETVTYFPGVLYAQPDYIYEEAAYELQDEYLAEQYYLDMVKATEAWEYMDTVECSDVLVAIIDSGIYFNHEDIDFIDYEKSVLVDGGADIEIRPIESEESNNHGTHVAGIIGATANDIGIAGVASGSEHVKAIMIDADIYGDFYTSVLIKAVDYASESGARVINMSLGGTKGTSATDILYQDAVENAYKKGALVVAAAGNSNSNKVVFPSDAEHAVSVIATNEDGLKASYSNYGGADSAINKVCAPGTDIMSTTADGMYANMSGSSMAAPIVSAIAAMMISVNPSLTCEDVRQIIFGTATDLYDEGYDYYSGYGMVNAYECVKKAAETTTTGVDSINIVAPETTVTKGGTLQLSHSGDADTVGYWSSSDTRTATVDQTGLVTSINDGTADITYYTSNGLKDSVTITCVGSANAQKLETPVIANNNTGYSFIYWMPIENADYYEIYCSTEIDGEYQYLTTTTDRKYSRRESTEVGQLYYGYSDDVYYKVRACSNSADYLCSDFSEVNKSMWAPTTYSRIFFEDISATSTLVTWYGRGYCSLYTSDSRDGEYKLVATYDQGREALEYLDTDITVGQRKYYQVRYFNECTVESSQSYLDKEGYDNHVNSYGVLNSDDTLPAPNLKKVKTSELTDDPTQPYIRIYGNVGSENANTYYNVYVEESVDGGITWKPAYSKSVINVVCSDSYGNYDFGHKLEFGEDVLIRYALMRKVRDYPDDSENYDTSLYIGEFSDIISVSTSANAEPRIIGVTKDDEFYNVTWDANVDDSDVKKVIYEYRVLNADNTYSTGTVSVTVNGTLEKTKSFSIADIGENASFRIRLYINNTGLSCENTDVTVTVSSRYSIYSKYVSVASSKEHVIKHIVAKEPTFFRAGNIDCYYCRHCDKYYSDAKGLEEISKETAIIDCNKDISDCEVSVDKHSLTYNGYSVIPCIKLYSGGKQVGSENYTLEYENNNSVGDATITLTGNPAFGVTGKKVLVLPIDLQDIVLNNIQIDDNHVVSLSWNSVPGAEYYDIYSRPAGRDIWTRTGSTKVNTFSEEVRVHDTIEYCVMAVAGEISKVSNSKSIEIPLTIPKTAITYLTNISNGITIKWNESEGATAYEVYRKEDGGTYSKIATVSGLTYTDSDTKTNGTKYTYYVKAIAIEGEKTYEAENSDEKEIYFVTAPTISSVTASATGTVVKWNKID